MSSSSAEYKKALKTLEGEKRAALKKAKTLKGAKGKEAIAQIEEEFTKKGEELLAQFQDQQQQEPSTETSQDDTGVGGVLADATTTTSGMPDIITKEESTTAATTEEDEEEQERQRKKGKNLRKKEKQRQKEKEKQQQEEEAHAQAMSGPNLKQMEWDQIQNHLNPLQLKVQQVVADGHCLYRAIGSHIGKTHIEIRTYLQLFLCRYCERQERVGGLFVLELFKSCDGDDDDDDDGICSNVKILCFLFLFLHHLLPLTPPRLLPNKNRFPLCGYVGLSSR